MRRPGLLLFVVLMLGVCAPAGVRAADEGAELEVWAVRATKKNKDVSSELKDLARLLEKQFKYTGFKLEKKAAKRVDLGKAFQGDLLEDYQVSVTPQERSERRIKLEVVVTRKVKDKDGKPKAETVLKTTLTTQVGPFVPVGCGSLKDGDYLILLVRAR